MISVTGLWRTLSSASTALLLVWAFTACSIDASSSNTPTSTPGAPPATATGFNTASGPISQVDVLAENTTSHVSPAVVKIENVGIGLGSGVIMSPDGYIVTNNHVVANAKRVRVSLANGETLPARIVGTDQADDLAVVKVNMHSLPTAHFGDSSKLAVGQTVLAIGNPLGITQTVTEGIVSALNRTVDEGQGGGVVRRAVQTSAPINPGNSGGALVDLASQVIGIPTLNAVDPESNTPANGIGFAIPSNTVTSIASQIIKYGRVIHTGRAALGISVASVTPDLAAQYGLPVAHGVLIASLVKHGPADTAGLKPRDIIVKWRARPIASETDLLDVLANENVGDTIAITVVDQQGKQHVYRVKLGEIQANSNS